jgi:signal transduction histidine kinase
VGAVGDVAGVGSVQGAARRDVLSAYGVIGAPVTHDLQALVEVAAQVCGTPMAAINLIDDRQQHAVATVGVKPGTCSTEESMCARILDAPGPVRVSDARLDPRFASNPFVDGTSAAVRFYASSQLRTPSGVTVGTLCVFDMRPRTLSDEGFRSLNLLARQVVDVLELQRLSQELRRSNERLAGFAGQVSHDLRNPLSAVSGLLELVSDSPALQEDAVATGLLQRASGATHRMAELIDELLAFARLGGRLRLGPTDLEAVVGAVLDDLGALIASSGARIEAASLPVVTADRVQVQAVLQNLVANALRHARDDVPPTVTVSAARLAAGWRISVDDNGPGVPEHLREKVFQLFDRGEKGPGGIGSQEHPGGSGIGLNTCQRIIEAHGGAIGIDESPMGGASAWFILPDESRDQAPA